MSPARVPPATVPPATAPGLPMAMARARSNIALVKYWGKRDRAKNLPATGSLSVTLSSLYTTTHVTFDDELEQDELHLSGVPASGAALARVGRFLDHVRALAGRRSFACVVSENSFPTAAGLASSASGFAALALAATTAAGLRLSTAELGRLARLGSGSAPRSLLGGFVELPAGTDPDGNDCTPLPLAPASHWDLRLVVALTARGEKPVGSTKAMEDTRRSSPYYPAWLKANATQLDEARQAVRDRDLTRLGQAMEASCFRMHASMLAASPPLLYWNGATVDALRAVWDLRARGVEGYVTIDAGPHVKVLTTPAAADAFVRALRLVGGVHEVLVESLGAGAELLS